MEMTMTTDEHELRTARSYKLILLFAMVSMTMMFAGLTSAFCSAGSRVGIKNFELPTAFYFSTIAIIGCSVTFHLATKKSIKKDKQVLQRCFF
jgi:cytochrome c oxidase subunit 3